MNESQRLRILARDGHKCKLGPHDNDDKRLHVHHFNDLVPGMGFVSAYELENDKDLITLCAHCHGVFNRRGRSKKRWEFRRRLTRLMYGVDIGPCEFHRWTHQNGLTYCSVCLKPK
jgi:hypothetical protein